MKRGVVTVLAAGVVLLYGFRLDHSPVHLHHDEVFFALNAHAIASAWRDTAGHFLPLYFEVAPRVWFHPVLVYAMAAVLKVLPLREWVIRLPAVTAGLADILLIYLIAARLFDRRRTAVAAALLLALAPAHFIHSRLAMDYLLPVPFVLLWLLCLAIFFERRRTWVLLVATAVLGLGVYSYIAAIIIMPVCLGLTFAALIGHRVRTTSPYLVAAFGFMAALVPLIVWSRAHPAAYANQITRYGVYDASRLTPFQGLRALLGYSALSDRLSVLYNYFNPSFLFLSGDASLIDSTRQAGVFLLAMAVFLALGLHRMISERRSGLNLVVLAGFFTAPVAATIVGEPFRISRAMTLVPFGVLISAAGVEAMAEARSRAWRLAAVLLLALVPVEFARFHADYLTGYRARSSAWFEGAAGDAFERAIARTAGHDVPAVYLSRDIRWVADYWNLYLIKHNREDLLPRTAYFDRVPDARVLRAGTLVVEPCGDADAPGAADRYGTAAISSGLRPVDLITAPDGRTRFAILEKE